MPTKRSTTQRSTARGPAKPRSAKNATQPTRGSVTKSFGEIEHPTRRKDAKTLAKMFAAISGHKPKMWGASIAVFGEYHYVYDSGREGDLMRIGFSPRSQNLVIYIIPGFQKSKGLLAKLGKHKVGKSCLYVNKLDGVVLRVLEQLAERAWKEMERKYPA